MADFKLTTNERKLITDWLNGQGGDSNYYIDRMEGGITHFRRQTINIGNGAWKARIAYEAESGFPVAMGSPIHTSRQGKHDRKPGQATLSLVPLCTPPSTLYNPGPKWKLAMKDAPSFTLAEVQAQLSPLPTYLP